MSAECRGLELRRRVIKRQILAAVVSLLVAVMVLSDLPVSTEAKKGGMTGLSQAELDFAEAVGTGEYAYGID